MLRTVRNMGVCFTTSPSFLARLFFSISGEHADIMSEAWGEVEIGLGNVVGKNVTIFSDV